MGVMYDAFTIQQVLDSSASSTFRTMTVGNQGSSFGDELGAWTTSGLANIAAPALGFMGGVGASELFERAMPGIFNPFTTAANGARLGGGLAQAGSFASKAGWLGGGIAGAGMGLAMNMIPYMAAEYAVDQTAGSLVEGSAQYYQTRGMMGGLAGFAGEFGEQSIFGGSGFLSPSSGSVLQTSRQLAHMGSSTGLGFEGMTQMTGFMAQSGLLAGNMDNPQEMMEGLRQRVSQVQQISQQIDISLMEAVQVLSALNQSGVSQGQQVQAAVRTGTVSSMTGESMSSLMNQGLAGSQAARQMGLDPTMGYNLAISNRSAMTSLSELGIIDHETVQRYGGAAQLGQTLTGAMLNAPSTPGAYDLMRRFVNEEGNGIDPERLSGVEGGTRYSRRRIDPYALDDLRREFSENEPDIIFGEIGRLRERYGDNERRFHERQYEFLSNVTGITDPTLQQTYLTTLENRPTAGLMEAAQTVRDRQVLEEAARQEAPGLLRQLFETIGRAVEDHVAEPARDLGRNIAESFSSIGDPFQPRGSISSTIPVSISAQDVSRYYGSLRSGDLNVGDLSTQAVTDLNSRLGAREAPFGSRTLSQMEGSGLSSILGNQLFHGRPGGDGGVEVDPVRRDANGEPVYGFGARTNDRLRASGIVPFPVGRSPNVEGPVAYTDPARMPAVMAVLQGGGALADPLSGEFFGNLDQERYGRAVSSLEGWYGGSERAVEELIDRSEDGGGYFQTIGGALYRGMEGGEVDWVGNSRGAQRSRAIALAAASQYMHSNEQLRSRARLLDGPGITTPEEARLGLLNQMTSELLSPVFSGAGPNPSELAGQTLGSIEGRGSLRAAAVTSLINDARILPGGRHSAYLSSQVSAQLGDLAPEDVRARGEAGAGVYSTPEQLYDDLLNGSSSHGLLLGVGDRSMRTLQRTFQYAAEEGLRDQDLFSMLLASGVSPGDENLLEGVFSMYGGTGPAPGQERISQLVSEYQQQAVSELSEYGGGTAREIGTAVQDRVRQNTDVYQFMMDQEREGGSGMSKDQATVALDASTRIPASALSAARSVQLQEETLGIRQDLAERIMGGISVDDLNSIGLSDSDRRRVQDVLRGARSGGEIETVNQLMDTLGSDINRLVNPGVVAAYSGFSTGRSGGSTPAETESLMAEWRQQFRQQHDGREPTPAEESSRRSLYEGREYVSVEQGIFNTVREMVADQGLNPHEEDILRTESFGGGEAIRTYDRLQQLAERGDTRGLARDPLVQAYAQGQGEEGVTAESVAQRLTQSYTRGQTSNEMAEITALAAVTHSRTSEDRDRAARDTFRRTVQESVSSISERLRSVIEGPAQLHVTDVPMSSDTYHNASE